MKLPIHDLDKDHPFVRAAQAMVIAHRDHDTMLPALEEVSEKFPVISDYHLALLWIGINAKDISSSIEIERLTGECKEWSEKWLQLRRDFSKQKYPGLTNTVRPLDRTQE